MKKNGFENAGVSYGLSFMNEVNNTDELVSLADQRMYKHKRRDLSLLLIHQDLI